MASVTVNKDLTQVKDKLAFGLTRRQIVCFCIAALVAVPAYFLTRTVLGNDLALLLLVALAFPPLFFAFYEKNGQPPEKLLKYIIRLRFKTPTQRPYRTQNRYALLERQNKHEQEVQRFVADYEKKYSRKGRWLGASGHQTRHKADKGRKASAGKGHSPRKA